jgi:hypothetical protein
MTIQQLRSEINKVLDNVPENILQDILDYLKEFQSKTREQIEMTHHLSQILKEDRELLKKLAQ